MPWIVGCCVALAISCLLVGHELGAESERSVIANECRQSGAFTNKRTGFMCSAVDRGEK